MSHGGATTPRLGASRDGGIRVCVARVYERGVATAWPICACAHTLLFISPQIAILRSPTATANAKSNLLCEIIRECVNYGKSCTIFQVCVYEIHFKHSELFFLVERNIIFHNCSFSFFLLLFTFVRFWISRRRV